jgi:hypothetical protein
MTGITWEILENINYEINFCSIKCDECQYSYCGPAYRYVVAHKDPFDDNLCNCKLCRDILSGKYRDYDIDMLPIEYHISSNY